MMVNGKMVKEKEEGPIMLLTDLYMWECGKMIKHLIMVE